MELSSSEKIALALMGRKRSILVTSIPDKNDTNVFGDTIPGIAVFKKLEKKGLIFFTEEDVDSNGFAFTEEVYITELGKSVAKKLDLQGDE